MVPLGLILKCSSNFISATIGTSKFRYGSKRIGARCKPDITTVTEWPRELRSERLSSSFRRSWHRYQSLGPAVLKCLDRVPDKDAGSRFLIRQ